MKIGKGLIAVILIVAILAVSGMSLMGLRNEAVEKEERINSQLTANKSSYDSMWKKFVEMTQVTELQAKAFKEVYDGMISGRYNDANLLFKAVQEQNPQFDQSNYGKIMNAIEAGRDSFNNEQKKIADMVGQYNIFVRKHFIMAAITGRKTMDPNKFIVTSERTDGAFSTGQDGQIDLTGK